MTTQTKKPLWEIYEERYADFVKAVRQDHISRGKFGGGHDFTHALMVARYAILITEGYNIPGEKRGYLGLLTWIAAICHNTDRLLPKGTSPEVVATQIEYYLLTGEVDLGKVERELVVEAVLEHHNRNKPEDSAVTIALKDADRLANIGPNNIIRSGQLHEKLPAYDPRYVADPDPEATYKVPKTCLHDVLCSLEWEPWLRYPTAIELAAPYFDYYRRFKEVFVRQMQEVGFIDEKGNSTYPFPEDLELAYKEQEAAH